MLEGLLSGDLCSIIGTSVKGTVVINMFHGRGLVLGGLWCQGPVVNDTGVSQTDVGKINVSDTNFRGTSVNETGVRDTNVKETGFRDSPLMLFPTPVAQTPVQVQSACQENCTCTFVWATGVGNTTGVKATGVWGKVAGTCSIEHRYIHR